MDIGTKSHINRLYFFSFITAIVLLPWTVKGCNYALIVMIVAGLISTPWKEKSAQVLANKELFVFIALFGLYLLGLIYTENISAGLKSIEKKLILILPLLIVSSISLTDKQRMQAQLFFVLSMVVFTITCIVWKLIVDTNALPYAQINFDAHTLARFNEFHPNANPLWMRFSYIAFAYPLIKSTTVYSLYLSLSVFILFYYEPNSKSTLTLKYIVIAFFSIVIVLLASRIGIFVLFVVGVYNVLQKFGKGKLGYAVASAIPLFVFLLLLAFPVARYRTLEEPLNTPLRFAADPNAWNSFNLRFLQWNSSIKGIKEHVLTGAGTGGAKQVLNSYYDQANLGDFELNYGANNQFLEVYLEIGIAGFLVFTLCFIAPFFKGWKNRDPLLISLVLMIGVACISNSMFESARGLPFYIVFVSLFMFTKKKDDSEIAR